MNEVLFHANAGLRVTVNLSPASAGKTIFLNKTTLICDYIFTNIPLVNVAFFPYI